MFCLLPLVFIVRIVRIQSFIRVNGFITSTFLIFKTARKISIKMKMHIFISFRFIHDQKWERKPHQMTSIRYLETVHGTIVWTISLVCERAVFYWKSSLWNVAKVRDNGVKKTDFIHFVVWIFSPISRDKTHRSVLYVFCWHEFHIHGHIIHASRLFNLFECKH